MTTYERPSLVYRGHIPDKYTGMEAAIDVDYVPETEIMPELNLGSRSKHSAARPKKAAARQRKTLKDLGDK